jgi:SagB-type dehydrogenase family enzyme
MKGSPIVSSLAGNTQNDYLRRGILGLRVRIRTHISSEMNTKQPFWGAYDDAVISELYLENSKHHRSDLRAVDRNIAAMSSPVLQRMTASAYKRYPSARCIALAKHANVPTLMSFDEALLTQHSFRDFTGEGILLAHVNKLLQMACGITGWGGLPSGDRQFLRTASSGGGFCPIEVYVLIRSVQGLPGGIYHYNPVKHCLEILREGDVVASDLTSITFTAELKKAAVVFGLTGIALKSRLNYAESGYRFMLLEAGHIAQSLLLTANSLNLRALPIGGFVDDELDRLLNVDGVEETSLYLVAVGRR